MGLVRRDLDSFSVWSCAWAQDGRIDGTPYEGRLQLRPVPQERHAGEDGPQDARVQEDRDYHRRPRVCGEALLFSTYSLLVLRYENYIYRRKQRGSLVSHVTSYGLRFS